MIPGWHEWLDDAGNLTFRIERIPMSKYQGIGPLFDICANKHEGNENSVEANKIAHKGKEGAKQRILNALSLCGYGICEELEEILYLSHQTCSARLSELRREGKIKIVGQRKTKSGSPAAVYQAL